MSKLQETLSQFQNRQISHQITQTENNIQKKIFCFSDNINFDKSNHCYTIKHSEKLPSHILLDSLHMNITLYNILTNYKIEIEITSSKYTIVIPIGQYTIDEIVEYINEKLQK